MTEAHAIDCEIMIAAPPERVFRYFVEPAAMAQWLGQQHRLDPRPGGIFRVTVSRGAVASGTYLQVTPYSRVVFTWGWEGRDDLPPGASLVEIELEACQGGTLVRLHHSGLRAGARVPFTPGEHGSRWAHYLAKLAQHCITLEIPERRNHAGT
jgi:uncharacterized protein YndB with AHSA1/START domain